MPDARNSTTDARPVLVLDGTGLTCRDVADAARGRRRIELADGVLSRVAAAHDLAVELVAARPVYGRTTGVGANKDVTLSGGDGRGGAEAEQARVRALLRSHATAAGPARAPERVRGMLVVRLHQLAAGASGASPDVVAALLAMVQADDLPAVRELGSVGTGDLPALAATALALDATVPFTVHDALPFLSSSAATIADSALARQRLATLARAAVAVGALTFTAVRGNPEAFSAAVERAAPFPGSRQVCRWMRALVDTAAPAARIQDPFALRTLPQVHGTLLDALDHLARVTEALANHPGENPLIVVRPGQAGIAHHGAFHLAPLATALDTARSALVQSGQLVLRRLALLIDPAATGLQPFLSDGTPGSSGVMPLEYVAASALADLQAAAAPVATGTVTISRDVEDDASFAPTAARLALEAARPLRVLVACELVAAVRALRQQGKAVTGPCAALPDDDADRDLSTDLDTAGDLLDDLADTLDAT